MEMNVAYSNVQVDSSSQATAEPLYELVSERADQHQATTSVPKKVKAGKKSLYIFTTVVIVVAIVLALLALVLAVIAIVPNPEFQSLQSKVNILNVEIQALKRERNISNQKIQSLQSEVNIIKTPVTFPLGAMENPASSCRDIPQDSPSGEYWILTSSTQTVQVYCDMDRVNCSCHTTSKGWMRVANFDMTDPSQQCPDEFGLVSRTTAPLRTCGRTHKSIGYRCVSTTYQTYGMEYSHVCGQIRGYQDGSPDAFGPYHINRFFTVDSSYVDGVSLTHGQSPRQHIWTFAAALDEVRSNRYTCPCTQPGVPYTGIVPPFIGQDYFCETGSREHWQQIFYPDDPLWDGQGCGGNSTCCQFNNPPWFCKQLLQPTTDDIELRLCAKNELEDVPLELVKIYVH